MRFSSPNHLRFDQCRERVMNSLRSKNLIRGFNLILPHPERRDHNAAFYLSHIGDLLHLQEFVSDEWSPDTSTRVIDQSDAHCLGRWLHKRRPGIQSEQTHRPCQFQYTQKHPPVPALNMQIRHGSARKYPPSIY